MEARAQARYVRVTPRKARRVVDLIRGLPAGQAQAVLAFAPQAASDPVGKVLASAIANAETTRRLDREALVVSRAWVDEGPTLKRFRPRAQGRAYRINKRTSHITVIIAEQQAPAAASRTKSARDEAKAQPDGSSAPRSRRQGPQGPQGPQRRRPPGTERAAAATATATSTDAGNGDAGDGGPGKSTREAAGEAATTQKERTR